MVEDIVAEMPAKVIDTPDQTTILTGDTIGIGDGGNYSLMPVMSIVEGGGDIFLCCCFFKSIYW